MFNHDNNDSTNNNHIPTTDNNNHTINHINNYMPTQMLTMVQRNVFKMGGLRSFNYYQYHSTNNNHIPTTDNNNHTINHINNYMPT
jgi:hypothetical protein